VKTLLCGLVLAAAVGCMNVQPVGKMAKVMGPSKGKPLPAAAADADVPDPVIVAAPRPVPPALLITPGEVTPESTEVAAQKLMNEFEYDRKTTTPTKTAEVSVYRGGVKQ
jgi:hypothetical protein